LLPPDFSNRLLDQSQYLGAARDLSGEICERAQRGGGFALLPNVEAGAFCAGLWNGAAGVGAHLLQMAHPRLMRHFWDFSAP